MTTGVDHGNDWNAEDNDLGSSGGEDTSACSFETNAKEEDGNSTEKHLLDIADRTSATLSWEAPRWNPDGGTPKACTLVLNALPKGGGLGHETRARTHGPLLEAAVTGSSGALPDFPATTAAMVNHARSIREEKKMKTVLWNANA